MTRSLKNLLPLPFLQEYSLIMSERDSVHKEIEKLQEEVSSSKKKMSAVESKSKSQDDEVIYSTQQFLFVAIS